MARVFLLPAFAAVFLGATAITPGRFNPWGTLIAVYFLRPASPAWSCSALADWVQRSSTAPRSCSRSPSRPGRGAAAARRPQTNERCRLHPRGPRSTTSSRTTTTSRSPTRAAGRHRHRRHLHRPRRSTTRAGASPCTRSTRRPTTRPSARLAASSSSRRDAASTPARIEGVLHGTTLATNAVLEHRGARTGLITTAGFRDVLHIGRHQRPEHYSVTLDIPWQTPPFAQRDYRSRSASGSRRRAARCSCRSTRTRVRGAARELGEASVEAIAICFLHAYLERAHERARARDRARGAAGRLRQHLGATSRRSSASSSASRRPR